MKDALRAEVGRRLRARRQARGLTVKALAAESGLSQRYVISAEHGDANLSLEKLRQLAAALEVPMAWFVSSGTRGEIDGLLIDRSPAELAEIATWLRRRYGRQQRPIVALLGVRGAGKSAVGQGLARRLGLPFIELDERVEAVADLSLAEVFAVHGEDYYRRLEHTALTALVNEGQPAVVATGGGIVTHAENYARLREAATTVWLKAAPEDHWDRVIQQGDRRPMRDHPHAMAELRALLAARAPLYEQADIIVDTHGQALAAVIDDVAGLLEGRDG